jgi:hypothetical protein
MQRTSTQSCLGLISFEIYTKYFYVNSHVNKIIMIIKAKENWIFLKSTEKTIQDAKYIFLMFLTL